MISIVSPWADFEPRLESTIIRLSSMSKYWNFSTSVGARTRIRITLKRCQASICFGNRARFQTNGRCGEEAFWTTSPLLPNLTFAADITTMNSRRTATTSIAQGERYPSGGSCRLRSVRGSRVLPFGPFRDKERTSKH
jgi:hypothetical protein